MNVEQLIGKI